MSETIIAVTGATGQLGRLVVEALLKRGVSAGRVVAAVRDPLTVDGLLRELGHLLHRRTA